MSENYEMPDQAELSFEERFGALEHQCYLMYLQLNAVTQLLVESNNLQREDIGKKMDTMHEEVVSAVKQIQEEEAEEAANAESQ
jgi:hypothetical protein